MSCPTGAKLRNRSKAKNFNKAWESYSASFKAWFNSLPQSHQTSVINNGITMGDDGRFANNIMAEFKTHESQEKKKERSSGWKTEAHILEVAEQMCGGREKLMAAIKRGAVIVHKEGDVELYSFPKSEVSLMDTVAEKVQSTADVESTLDAHMEVKAWCLELPRGNLWGLKATLLSKEPCNFKHWWGPKQPTPTIQPTSPTPKQGDSAYKQLRPTTATTCMVWGPGVWPWVCPHHLQCLHWLSLCLGCLPCQTRMSLTVMTLRSWTSCSKRQRLPCNNLCQRISKTQKILLETAFLYYLRSWQPTKYVCKVQTPSCKGLLHWGCGEGWHLAMQQCEWGARHCEGAGHKVESWAFEPGQAFRSRKEGAALWCLGWGLECHIHGGYDGVVKHQNIM